MVSLFVRSFLHSGVEVVPQLAQNLPSWLAYVLAGLCAPTRLRCPADAVLPLGAGPLWSSNHILVSLGMASLSPRSSACLSRPRIPLTRSCVPLWPTSKDRTSEGADGVGAEPSLLPSAPSPPAWALHRVQPVFLDSGFHRCAKNTFCLSLSERAEKNELPTSIRSPLSSSPSPVAGALSWPYAERSTAPTRASLPTTPTMSSTNFSSPISPSLKSSAILRSLSPLLLDAWPCPPRSSKPCRSFVCFLPLTNCSPLIPHLTENSLQRLYAMVYLKSS
mmetsp:Transcript_5169/g.15612  ORF Transcript_5169/g.15612 Transcript_5169/m.15612 type:complete len:277 (+) Transcript_5169:1025-1855(+)